MYLWLIIILFLDEYEFIFEFNEFYIFNKHFMQKWIFLNAVG